METLRANDQGGDPFTLSASTLTANSAVHVQSSSSPFIVDGELKLQPDPNEITAAITTLPSHSWDLHEE